MDTMVIMVAMVMVVMVVRTGPDGTGRDGTGRDGHLNLNFQVTCDWQLSQFLRCFQLGTPKRAKKFILMNLYVHPDHTIDILPGLEYHSNFGKKVSISFSFDKDASLLNTTV